MNEDSGEGVMYAQDGRGLHSSTFRLNVSAFCVLGGAFRSRLRGVWQVAKGISKGCLGCILCQKGLRLS
jgi:hypothetical protein